jgi:hypothetical protein
MDSGLCPGSNKLANDSQSALRRPLGVFGRVVTNNVTKPISTAYTATFIEFALCG